MRKLRLELEDLVVESFATAAAPEGAGTVRGHAGAQPASGEPCPPPVPDPYDTGCVATYDPCTRVPIETCSCAPDTY